MYVVTVYYFGNCFISYKVINSLETVQSQRIGDRSGKSGFDGKSGKYMVHGKCNSLTLLM